MQYTIDQILQLAPDEASAKAGQQLANGNKWVEKSRHEKALWGSCQGSGKVPYKTIVDLTNIAFKCTCPSRKFPCKHGLGLMLLYAKQPNEFANEDELPQHVTEWIGKRDEKKVTSELKQEKPVDEAAKAKRVESREKKIANGIEELRMWIKDVVRTGIMNVPQQSYQFNQNIIARMVDAQAPGLANQLRQINTINFFEDGWQRQLLKRLGAIYLITEAFQNVSQLPVDMAKELQTLIGWNQAKEELLQQTPISDKWIVVAIRTTEEGNISVERIWLFGTGTMRFALLLNFYAGNQVPQQLFFLGMYINADLVYYQGVLQLRALVKKYELIAQNSFNVPVNYSLDALYLYIANQLSQNPFIEQMPFFLAGAFILFKDNKWYVNDADSKGFNITNANDECWLMLAFTKGKSCSFFGVYKNEQFQIQSLWLNNKTHFVK